jgi:hypothetical protein
MVASGVSVAKATSAARASAALQHSSVANAAQRQAVNRVFTHAIFRSTFVKRQ